MILLVPHLSLNRNGWPGDTDQGKFDFTGSTSHVSVKRSYGVKNKNFDKLQTG
jgi:hypothetical protein